MNDVSLGFLREAKDYLEKNAASKLQNDPGLGYPPIVYAYDTTWLRTRRWIDKGANALAFYYNSVEEPTFPEKIFIETYSDDVPQRVGRWETVRFYGKPIYEQHDNWGRRKVAWMADFREELNQCETEEEVLDKIQEIQKREGVFKQ